MPPKKKKQTRPGWKSAEKDALRAVLEIVNDPEAKSAERLKAADIILSQCAGDETEKEMTLEEARAQLQALGLVVQEP